MTRLVSAQRELAMTTIPFPEFTPQARKRWESVPNRVREKILESVWCVNCSMGTPMELRAGRMEDECVILDGTCRICGHDVARLIEPEE